MSKFKEVSDTNLKLIISAQCKPQMRFPKKQDENSFTLVKLNFINFSLNYACKKMVKIPFQVNYGAAL